MSVTSAWLVCWAVSWPVTNKAIKTYSSILFDSYRSPTLIHCYPVCGHLWSADIILQWRIRLLWGRHPIHITFITIILLKFCHISLLMIVLIFLLLRQKILKRGGLSFDSQSQRLPPIIPGRAWWQDQLGLWWWEFAVPFVHFLVDQEAESSGWNRKRSQLKVCLWWPISAG